MRPDVRRALVVSALIATACIASGGDELGILGLSGGDDLVFLSQPVAPSVGMEALFEGRVRADAEGCLRLVGPDPATVVWPYRARLDGLTVRAATGRSIGRLGGEFRLGGGEVRFLPEGIVARGLKSDQVSARCPGRFWIVGDVAP